MTKIKHYIVFILILPLFANVDYSSEIQPIFNSRCTNCHGSSGGLSLSSYNNVMNGGNSGEVVIPFDSSNSILWVYVNSGYMPPGSNDLSNVQIDLISQWIDEGALPEPNEILLGDINNDGMLNVLDVVQLVNFILEVTDPSDYEFSAADMNSDNNINVLDVVILVNIILNG